MTVLNRQVARLGEFGPPVAHNANHATGATAGVPGSFTPAGAAVPTDLADMSDEGIVATPATAWTSGQFVQTATEGAAGRATWTGTDWVGGVAPLDESSE